MPANTPGKLKIFLGYARGVGKAKVMVEEAKRRNARGERCAIAIISEGDRIIRENLNEGIEVIPPLVFSYGGKDAAEINIPLILERRPGTVLVDNIAHINAPGSSHEFRYQDVEELLLNGINVLATMNVANLESLNDDVFEITGTRISERVPDRIFHDADEVELVDLTPSALINRIRRGDVLPAEEIESALANTFTEVKLNAMRELAMREVARRVDEDLVAWKRKQRIARPWQTSDRVLICISPTRSSLRLIRRGWRLAQKMLGEARVCYVEEKNLPEVSRRILEDDFKLCERLGIPTVTLQGEIEDAIIRYVEENNVTQVILGHSERTKIQEFLKGSLMIELAKHLKSVDLLIVATEQPTAYS